MRAEPMNADFCVVCGRTDRPVQEGICAECYAKRHPLVTGDPHATVTMCPTCGARLVGSHWERRGASTLLTPQDLAPLIAVNPEAGIREIHWEESGNDPLFREVRGTFRVRFRGLEEGIEVPLSVHVTHRTCPECARRTGRYYTARIQLRGPEGGRGPMGPASHARLGELFDRVIREARKDWRSALSWKEALPEGWDYYLTDKSAARGISRLLREYLGGEVKESASLYGRKDGREVYRTTIRLRVPAEAIDDSSAGPFRFQDERRRSRVPLERHV